MRVGRKGSPRRIGFWTDAAGQLQGILSMHAADLASVVEGLPAAPVVVAHSFAGLKLQK